MNRFEALQKMLQENPDLLNKIADEGLKEELAAFAEEKDPPKYVPIPIDRNGECPNCEEDWDGGDMFEQLKRLDIFVLDHKEAEKAAMKYGWTPENAKRFSHVISLQFSTNEVNNTSRVYDFIECPQCRHVFNIETGQEFMNKNEARNSLYE